MRFAPLIALPLITSCLWAASPPKAAPSEPARDLTLDALRATVTVYHNVLGGEPTLKCAGVLLKNLVVTAAHCTQEGVEMSIQTYDSHMAGSNLYVPVTVGYMRVDTDLAFLFPTAVIPAPYHTVTLAPEVPGRGAKVVLIGHPLRLAYTITEGIVSHPQRKMDGIYWLHASVNMTSGNSGGPLFNRYGELIGIASYGVVSPLRENHLSMFVHLDTIKKEL